MTATQMTEWDETLVEAARSASAHAYAPYSRFAVGAALRLTDGSIITGANMENISYGLSLCAETVAIAAANAAGAMDRIAALAVVGGMMDAAGTGDGNGEDEPAAPISPCGRCRQIMAEAAMLAACDFPVYCASPDGKKRAVYTVSALLPHVFSAPALSGGADK